MKDFIKKYFKTFVYFYRYLGYRIFVILIQTFLYSLMDGLGLSMFLPLFHFASEHENNATQVPANQNKIVHIFNVLHIDFTLGNILLIMFVFFVIKGLLFYIKGLYDAVISRRFIIGIRQQLVGKFSTVSYKHFVGSDVGQIQNLMTGEVTNLFFAFKQYLDVLQSGIMIIIYMLFAFVINPQFALFIIIGAILFNLIFLKIYKFVKKESRRLVKARNDYQGMIIQLVANFKYLKATGTVGKYGKRVNTSINGVENVNFRLGKLAALSNAIREPVLVGIVVLVIALQVYVMGGMLSTIIVSLIFFYRALACVTAFQGAYNNFIGAYGTMDNMTTFQQEMEKHKEVQGSRIFGGFSDELSLNNVSFSYDNYIILKNLTLSIKKNSTVAFVGESGSGKTTLVSLIAGLLVATEGTYLIDNTDIKDLNRESFQKRIGYISQDPTIFNDTIYNNVTFWADKNDKENIIKFEKAIRDAQLSDFINSLENKEDALLGNNGINISGGQKQRISIARELFKNIEVLILDEATSALDSETEKYIQESIDALKGSCTILIVAHRLATVKNADEVVLMNSGKILETDSFDNLKEKSPIFKRMVELQEL